MRWILQFDRQAFWQAVTIAWFCLMPMSATAQSAAANESRPGSAPPATLTFENREIFVFRAALEGYSPSERAQGARARLDAVASRSTDERATTQQVPQGMLVKVGSAAIFAVAFGDVNTLTGDTLQTTVERTVSVLEIALAEHHEKHDLSRLGRAAAASMAATLVFGVLLVLLIRIVRWCAGRLELHGRALAEQLKVGEHRAVNPMAVATLLRRITQLVGWACALVLFYLWLAFVLERFPYTRPWGEQLQSFFLDTLTPWRWRLRPQSHVWCWSLSSCSLHGPGARSRRIPASCRRRKCAARLAGRGYRSADRRIVTIALWLFALAMAYPLSAGFRQRRLQGALVLAGVMISIGASGIVGQAMSGLMLTYSRAVRVANMYGSATPKEPLSSSEHLLRAFARAWAKR
jgi:hypothetical protein